MNTFSKTLHGLTHLIPGIPEHSDSANARHHRPAQGSHGQRHQGVALRSPNRHHQNPPRVLVGWQNRIARLVHADR
ncbi:hypothetical protein HII28_11080 [Planctomonas sp. JC2975]|uniref:hypothetical protein n=1 Tax=Planctomonas sp. JC2975 TaxID=2729626 RepID=UPI0014759D53|nr:hypothetical protein [Planctomonas sp. JC2975]NNC12417.1 hypothetical protein [Planctomonas sp. JC2975]